MAPSREGLVDDDSHPCEGPLRDNGDMEIKHTNEFAASPQAVARMLMDEAFLTRVCEASGATRSHVTVDGLRAHKERDLTAPPQAATFVKGDVTIIEDTTWSEPAADGSRTGTLVASSPTVSFLDMKGHATLRPGGKGTLVEYVGEFTINIPFMGRKLEAKAAPFLIEAMAIEQTIGEQWLAEHA